MDRARLALELEHYIRDYVPKGWKESIESVMFVPWVSVVDVNRVLNNDIPSKFYTHPIKEAVHSWLDKQWHRRVQVVEEGVFIDGEFEPWREE